MNKGFLLNEQMIYINLYLLKIYCLTVTFDLTVNVFLMKNKLNEFFHIKIKNYSTNFLFVLFKLVKNYNLATD